MVNGFTTIESSDDDTDVTLELGENWTSKALADKNILFISLFDNESGAEVFGAFDIIGAQDLVAAATRVIEKYQDAV